jgi:outer membrane protein
MMRKMNKTILSALIGLSCSFAASNTFAEDLLQVFEIATANDPTVLKAKSNADRQTYGIDRAMSALLPSINFSMSYDKSNSNGYEFNEDTLQFDSTDSDEDLFKRGISLQQSLFDLGAWKGLDIAQKQAMQSKASYDLAQQTLIVRVSNAYFDVLGNMDDLEFVQAEKRAIERQLEQTKQRFAVGLTAITDVHEAQAQFDNAVAREIVAKNDVET